METIPGNTIFKLKVKEQLKSNIEHWVLSLMSSFKMYLEDISEELQPHSE